MTRIPVRVAVGLTPGRLINTLWVTNDFPPRAGGIEQFLERLLAQLDPSSVRVLTAGAPGATRFDATLPYRVDRVGRRPLLPTPATARRLRQIAAAHGAEVVVFGAAWPLGELGARVALPTLALTHGHEAGLARVGGGPLIRRVARAVDAIGVISAFTRDALQPWIPPHTSVTHLPPGVDIDRFRPGDLGAARARLGLPAAAPLVLCVGRLVRRKGQDSLVEAWPGVRRRVPGARLALVGSGPLAGRLRARSRTLGLSAAVTLAGAAPGADLPSWHAAADVFAMPCRTRAGGLDVEGLGIVYLEAQASGVPVVAGRSGGAPEALIDGQTGRVVDGRSREQLTATLVELLSDRALRERLGAAGRRFVTEAYAWPVIAARLRGVLERLAAGDRS